MYQADGWNPTFSQVWQYDATFDTVYNREPQTRSGRNCRYSRLCDDGVVAIHRPQGKSASVLAGVNERPRTKKQDDNIKSRRQLLGQIVHQHRCAGSRSLVRNHKNCFSLTIQSFQFLESWNFKFSKAPFLSTKRVEMLGQIYARSDYIRISLRVELRIKVAVRRKERDLVAEGAKILQNAGVGPGNAIVSHKGPPFDAPRRQSIVFSLESEQSFLDAVRVIRKRPKATGRSLIALPFEGLADAPGRREGGKEESEGGKEVIESFARAAARAGDAPCALPSPIPDTATNASAARLACR